MSQSLRIQFDSEAPRVSSHSDTHRRLARQACQSERHTATVGNAQRLRNTYPWISVFFTKPSFFVPPLIPPTSHPLPPWHHPLTSPTCCWLLAQSRPPPPPPLGKKVWPPTCIGLALCCPSSMRNLLLVGFLPILYKPSYVSKIQILQSSKCYCVIIDINHC